MIRVTQDDIVYPALLSQVSKQFKQQIQLSSLNKDLLEYPNSFLGKQAVDVLSEVLKLKDRNVCILVGRALDAQGFFHDVCWTHRLRDSVNEVYKFSDETSDLSTTSRSTPDPAQLPTGVFTLLTDCYSSTCSKAQLCYSITCPRRFEQQYHHSKTSNHFAPKIEKEKPAADYWSSTVPKDILSGMSSKEITRQETIFEIIETEKEFVRDLENTMKFIIQPLRDTDIINQPQRREEFIKQVFSNMHEIHQINSRLLKKLLSRQKESVYVVDKIGDIFVNILNELYPYVEYGAQQAFGKNLLDDERSVNMELVKFLKDCEKLPEFRKLPIESFLNRPTTRLGRYPLLLKPVMEKATEGHVDRTLVPQALAGFKTVLTSINIEAGKAENVIRLGKLHKTIFGTDGEETQLKLLDEGRQLIRDGKLMLRKTTDTEITIFLFDHMLLLARKKDNGYKIVKKPIPLELVMISIEASVPVTTDSSKNCLLTIIHPGRTGGSYTLSASTEADRDTWVEAIIKQKTIITESKRKFDVIPIVGQVFPKANPINCACMYENQLIVGTDNGLFISTDKTDDLVHQRFIKIFEIDRISQLDVIPKIDTLLLLAELSEGTHEREKIRPKKIGSTVSFFKQGVCNNLTLVCTVKTTSTFTTVKIYEPTGLGVTTHQGKIGKLFKPTNEYLRLFKEFYVPSEGRSLHFLTSKLCVGCVKGFELVELENLTTQALLDPTDESLDFVVKREQVRPISIFRMKEGQFLLCYDEFGFFIDKLGRRINKQVLISWSGSPTHFSVTYPYVIAYEPTFIEIRHLETGNLQQVIPTMNLRVLSLDNNNLCCVMALQDSDHQMVFRLKLHSDFI